MVQYFFGLSAGWGWVLKVRIRLYQLSTKIWLKLKLSLAKWKIMTFIMATNVIANRPPERRQTRMPTAHAKDTAAITKIPLPPFGVPLIPEDKNSNIGIVWILGIGIWYQYDILVWFDINVKVSVGNGWYWYWYESQARYLYWYEFWVSVSVWIKDIGISNDLQQGISIGIRVSVER